MSTLARWWSARIEIKGSLVRALPEALCCVLVHFILRVTPKTTQHD